MFAQKLSSQSREVSRAPALVVSIQPYEDEALASVVARATRANVLGSTQIILRETGLNLAHPGTVGQEIGERTERLAPVLGCSETQLQALAHPYIDAEESLVKWGAGVMRRSDLLLDRRRIAPKAVRAAPYVRADWLCRYLPYDPITGELLLDTCPFCSKTLRWSRAWGIGCCEYCRNDISNVEQPRLPAQLLQPYRRFASLLSIVPAKWESARAMLDPALSDLPQPILVDLILSLGVALGDNPKPIGRARLKQLGNADTAAAASHGMQLIMSWPKGVQRRARTLIDDPKEGQGREGVIRAIRSLGDERGFDSKQVALIRAVLPEVFKDARRAVGLLAGPIMLQRDICRQAGISSKEVRTLAEAGALPVRVSTGKKRRNIQFSAYEAEEFCLRRRKSLSVEAVANRLGLPVYAIEQLIDAKLLEQELHPAVLLVDQQPRVTCASVEQLCERLAERIKPADESKNLVPLRTITRQVGGGLKSWDRLLEDILFGEATIYRLPKRAGKNLLDRIWCVPGSLSVGLSPWSKMLRNGQPRQKYMSQRDACEVLNLDASQIKPVIKSGRIRFEKCGFRLTCSITEVLAYATKMMPPAELAERFKTRPDAVHAAMRHSFPAVELVPGGWSREQVAATLMMAKAPEGDPTAKWVDL